MSCFLPMKESDALLVFVLKMTRLLSTSLRWSVWWKQQMAPIDRTAAKSQSFSWQNPRVALLKFLLKVMWNDLQPCKLFDTVFYSIRIISLTIKGVHNQISCESNHDRGFKMVAVNEEGALCSNDHTKSGNEHRNEISSGTTEQFQHHSDLSSIATRF